MKILLIVESASKCKKIEKLLNGYNNNTYVCKASYGHIYHLNKKIDTSSFEAAYYVIPERKKNLTAIKQSMRSCDKTYLCGDPDREGEQICYSLAKELKMNINQNNRVAFNEITAPALKDAIDSPRTIDMNMVHSQQSRAILDQLVGFGISPLLWKHIMFGLSGGRCQSAATRLIADREKEIEDHQSSNLFKVIGIFKNGTKYILDSDLNTTFITKQQISKFFNKIKNASFTIGSITDKNETTNPSAPFITSSLQQDAGKRFGISAKHTMQAAQKLYEAGLITYHRTDSPSISSNFVGIIHSYIQDKYGEQYLNPRTYKSKSASAQEAHECIRPTNIQTKTLSAKMNAIQKKVYTLIWKRTVASQMSAMIKQVYVIKINISGSTSKYFISKLSNILFDGFQKIYNLEIQPVFNINKISIGDKLIYNKIEAIQTFNQPIGRHTEHTLIREMERLGIGRPSTYASIVTVIQTRKYVVKKSSDGVDTDIIKITLQNKNITESTEKKTLGAEKNKLFITDIGMVVNNFLLEHFNNNIMDYTYTANMETELDKIAEGKSTHINYLNRFHNEFNPIVTRLKQVDKRAKNKYTRVIGTDNNEDVIVRIAKYGAVIQKGKCDGREESKCQYAHIPTGKSMTEVTMENALTQLQFPKDLGSYNGESILLKDGQYGCYIQYNGTNYSLGGKNCDPAKVSKNIAINAIKNKNSNIIKQFNDTIKIVNGKFGAYIHVEQIPDTKSKKKLKPRFVRLPKELKTNMTKLKKMTIAQVQQLIDA
jgi:DNA topoisomerase-1